MKTKSFIILKECRNLLKIVNLTNKNGLYLDRYAIPNWLFYFLYFLSLNLVFMLNIWFCFDNNFDLTAIIWPLTLMAAYIQMESILFCLVLKKDLLNEMLNRLQLLINQSKCVLF